MLLCGCGSDGHTPGTHRRITVILFLLLSFLFQHCQLVRQQPIGTSQCPRCAGWLRRCKTSSGIAAAAVQAATTHLLLQLMLHLLDLLVQQRR